MNGIHNAEPSEYEGVVSWLVILVACLAAYQLYTWLSPVVARHGKHAACVDGKAEEIRERRAASLEREADAIVVMLGNPALGRGAATTGRRAGAADASRPASTADRRTLPCPPAE